MGAKVSIYGNVVDKTIPVNQKVSSCPSYLFVLLEIIDNSQTLHYCSEYYGNNDVANFCAYLVDFDEKKIFLLRILHFANKWL